MSDTSINPPLARPDSPGAFDAMVQQPDTTQPFSFDSLPYYDSTSFANEFGSEAANLEYAILSSMLNGNGFAVDNYGAADQDPRLNGIGNGSEMLIDGNGSSPLGGTLGLAGMERAPVASPSVSGMAGGGLGGYGGLFDKRPGSSSATSPSGAVSFGGNVMSPPRLQDTHDLFPAVAAALKPEGPETAPQAEPTSSASDTSRVMTAEEVYRNVTKPYPYAQSYHYLVRHLKTR